MISPDGPAQLPPALNEIIPFCLRETLGKPLVILSFLLDYFVIQTIIHKMKIFYISKSCIILDNLMLPMTI